MGISKEPLLERQLLPCREGKAKIADVGLAQMVQTTHISNLNGMGTFAYAAPELLTGGKCNEVADIFSFGVLLWELVTGEMPRRGKLRDLRQVTCPAFHSAPGLTRRLHREEGCTLATLLRGLRAGMGRRSCRRRPDLHFWEDLSLRVFA